MSQFGKAVCLLLATTLIACTSEYTFESSSVDEKSMAILLEDMLLEPSQLSRNRHTGFIHIAGTSGSRVKPWPNGIIPLDFTADVTDEEREFVFSACKEWENRTLAVSCVLRTTETAFVRVQKSKPGCSSSVGFLGGVQTLNLENNNPYCWTRRTILHELGHSFGLFHEHQHPNRDIFVLVRTDKAETAMQDSYLINFYSVYDKGPSTYDFDSVMHYQLNHTGSYYEIRNKQNKPVGKAYLFARPGLLSISKASTVGTYEEVSNSDIIAIRNLYNYVAPPPEHMLTIAITGDGEGAINFNEFQTMSRETKRAFDKNTRLSLEALPAPGSQFISFKGDPDCASANFDLNKDIYCEAEFMTVAKSCGDHTHGTMWIEQSNVSTSEACPPHLVGQRIKYESVNQSYKCDDGTVVAFGDPTYSFLRFDDSNCKALNCGDRPDGAVWTELGERKTAESCPTPQIGTQTRVEQTQQRMNCRAGVVTSIGQVTMSFLRFENVTCQMPSCGQHPHGSSWSEATLVHTEELCVAPMSGKRIRVDEQNIIHTCEAGQINTRPGPSIFIAYDERSCVFPPPPPPPPPPQPALPPPTPDRLEVNQRLYSNQYIESSNGSYRLIYQSDGNLVMYKHGHALWNSATWGSPGFAVMQGDGNFVVYQADGTPVWASNTPDKPGGILFMQNDGNLVIYQNGNPVWASGTNE